MSVELYTTSGPGGNDADPQSATVGGSKPLHRFLRAQPKTIGIIVLILGASFFIVSIAVNVFADFYIWTVIPRGVLLGSLSCISGILFILAEHRPSKKTVAASLALSVVTILGTVWSFIHMMPDLYYRHYFRTILYDDNSTQFDYWYSHTEAMGLSVEVIVTCYSVVGVVISLVMSSLAVAALRSTRSQAVVVMTAAPTETPVE